MPLLILRTSRHIPSGPKSSQALSVPDLCIDNTGDCLIPDGHDVVVGKCAELRVLYSHIKDICRKSLIFHNIPDPYGLIENNQNPAQDIRYDVLGTKR